jgi:hypothetical protein
MRTLFGISPILCVWINAVVLFASTNADADTHVIVGTQRTTWKFGGQESTTSGKPLIVVVKKGDTVEIQIPGGSIPHGFVTINKRGDQRPVEAKDLVIACGEGSKSGAVLRETGCTGGPSNFGNPNGFVGKITLEVLDNFPATAAGVNFWCVIHQKRMWGIITLVKSSRKPHGKL